MIKLSQALGSRWHHFGNMPTGCRACSHARWRLSTREHRRGRWMDRMHVLVATFADRMTRRERDETVRQITRRHHTLDATCERHTDDRRRRRRRHLRRGYSESSCMQSVRQINFALRRLGTVRAQSGIPPDRSWPPEPLGKREHSCLGSVSTCRMLLPSDNACCKQE
ncbi:hypothetical protein SEVIR_8G005150v4 [Setaria viridis]